MKESNDPKPSGALLEKELLQVVFGCMREEGWGCI
jgi:hypothetical protein